LVWLAAQVMHAPAALQVLVPLQVPMSSPLRTGEQVPSAEASAQVWH
jgi:hypothetical protein